MNGPGDKAKKDEYLNSLVLIIYIKSFEVNVHVLMIFSVLPSILESTDLAAGVENAVFINSITAHCMH